MMNKFKKGELVIISGKGKEFNEENTNVLGRIKEKDYYFNQYLVEVFFGKNDWFKEEDLTPVFEKKNRKKDKYKVGLVIENRGLRYILDKMKEKDHKTIDMFQKADIFQEFTEGEKTYKMEQIYNQGTEQFVQFFLDAKFKSSKVEYNEKNGRIKYILFEQI